MSEQIKTMASGTGPCGSCSEFVSLRAEACPLCEAPTGFGLLTRLRADPRRVVKIVALLAVPVSAGAFTAGKLIGTSQLAETKALLERRPEIDSEQIAQAREAELQLHGKLHEEITALEAKLVELAPLAEEARGRRAELEGLDEDRINKARLTRQAEYDEIYGRGK